LLAPAVLPVPFRPEPGIWVEVRLLLSRDLIQGGINKKQRMLDAHVRAVCFTYTGVERISADAGADGSLRKIDRRNRTLDKGAQRRGKVRFQGCNKRTSSCTRCIRRSRTARQYNG